jgi:hypothetical protein
MVTNGPTLSDVHSMADSPPQSNPRNPNWGGRREGSGRKKRPLTLASSPRAPTPSGSTTHTTTQTDHLPVHTSALVSSGTLARGFCAPHSYTQPKPAHSLHPNTMTKDTTIPGTGGQHVDVGVDQQENGTFWFLVHAMISQGC